MSITETAAFFRVEGTLIQRGTLAASAYLASNAQGFKERALRVSALALGAPVYGFLAQRDRTLATRGAYAALRHMSEDRILELAEEYYEDVLAPGLYERGRELVKQARRDKHRVVLLGEGIQPVVERLARDVGADDYVCNRLEFVDGETTGKLLDPVIGGHDGATWVKRYAEQRKIDLARSVAYASHGADLLLLSAVGRPCAVNPDFALRAAARDASYPVLEYR